MLLPDDPRGHRAHLCRRVPRQVRPSAAPLLSQLGSEYRKLPSVPSLSPDVSPLLFAPLGQGPSPSLSPSAVPFVRPGDRGRWRARSCAPALQPGGLARETQPPFPQPGGLANICRGPSVCHSSPRSLSQRRDFTGALEREKLSPVFCKDPIEEVGPPFASVQGGLFFPCCTAGWALMAVVSLSELAGTSFSLSLFPS